MLNILLVLAVIGLPIVFLVTVLVLTKKYSPKSIKGKFGKHFSIEIDFFETASGPEV